MPTGVAMILVDSVGENQIVVAPGANAELGGFELAESDAVLCQLEVPDAAVVSAWEQATGLFCLNAAPARPIDVDADLTVVNRYELEVLKRRDGLVAVTLGAEGALLLEDGEEVARAEPPQVDAVDGTAAGDAFTACLLVSLLEGRDHAEALRRACAAGALAASRFGAQPSLPTAAEVDELLAQMTSVILDCDPGHDDAIALLLALASPEIDLVGVTTVHGNQTLEKTTDNALRVLALVGREDVPVAMGADRPLVRELHVAAHVHGESGLDGPDLPPRASEPVEQHGVDFLVEHVGPETVLVPVGPLTNVALALEKGIRPARIVLMGGAIAEGNMTPAAEFNIWADPEAAARVFASGLDVTMIGLDVTHRALLTPALAERFRAAGRVGTFVAELVEFYKQYHRRTYGWDGAPIHDAVALAHALRPGIVTTEHLNVEIELESELCRGRTVVDRWHRTDRAQNVHVGVEIDADTFFELMLDRIGKLG